MLIQNSLTFFVVNGIIIHIVGFKDNDREALKLKEESSMKKAIAALSAFLMTCSCVGESMAYAVKDSGAYESGTSKPGVSSGDEEIIKYSCETDDGFIYNSYNDHVEIIRYFGEGGDVVIPEKIDGLPVTEITEFSFDQVDLQSLTIPGTIKEIPDNFMSSIFTRPSPVEEVIIMPGLESIGDNCFNYCPYLRNIVLPEGLTSIGEMCFAGCSELHELELPDSLVSLGRYCFADTGLESISFPDSIIELPDYSFSSCYSLKQVRMPAKLEKIGDGVFSSCKAIEEIELPDSLESLGDFAFHGCESLKELVVPDKITEIKNEFCTGCISLERIKLPSDLKSIGSGFMCSTSIEYIEFPDTLTELPNSLCCGCRSLSRVKLPSNLKSFGYSAFYDCGLITIEVPETVTELPYDFCHSCNRLETVILHEGLKSIGMSSFENCISLEKIELPEGLEKIETQVFAFSGLRSLHIPASVNSISEYVCERCGNLAEFTVSEDNETYYSWDGVIHDKATNQIKFFPWGKEGEYVMPEIDYTGTNFSFDPNYKITSVVIADSYNWDSELFCGCQNIQKFSLKDTNKNFKISDDCVYTADGKKLVYIPFGKFGDYTVEEGIECIGSYAFSQSDLIEITFPESLKEIEENALDSLCYCRTVTFKGDTVDIGRNAFRNTLIRNLVLPANCVCREGLPTTLTSVTFSDGGKVVIEQNAFENCKRLEEVNFPKTGSGVYIKKAAFSGTGFKSLELPNTIREIGENAFADCDYLKSVVVNTDAVISKFTFRNDAVLEKVTFSKSNNIEDNAFSNCRKLTEIECSLDEPLNGFAFNGCSGLSYINGIEIFNDENDDFAPEIGGFIRENFKTAINVDFLNRWTLKQVDNVVAEVTDENMSEVEKAKALHDWVCDNAVYDYNDNNDYENHNDTAVFMDGIAVCDGYAKTYNLLLNSAGIETCFVVSDDHSWNIAKIDGKCFHIDTTWDDIKNNNDWFMLSDAQISADEKSHSQWTLQLPSVLHTFQMQTLPVCNTVMGDMDNDGVFTQSDIAKLSSYIAENGKYTVVADLDYNGKITAADISAGYEKMSVVMGDVNEDGEVGLADALSILQYVANSKKYGLSEKALRNADVYDNGDGITPMDALAIQKKDARLVSQLPCSYMIDGKSFVVE